MRFRDAFPAFDIRVFALEFFVDGKEMFDFAQDMRREIGMLANLRVSGACRGDGENFFIPLSLVDHFKQAYRPRFHQTTGESRVGHQDQNIQSITVRA